MKLAEDVFHQNKGVKKIRRNRGFNITPRVMVKGIPWISAGQQTWTSIRWGKIREGSRKDINKGDNRNLPPY